MPQKFYFHDATNSTSGTLPSGEQGAGTPGATFTGGTTNRLMDGNIGTSQVSQTLASGTSTSEIRRLIRMFISPPLRQGTYGSGTWTVNVADSESNLSANWWTNLVNVYFWRPRTGAAVGTVNDGSNGASMGGAEHSGTGERVTHWTFSGSNVTIQNGDVLVCELWSVSSQGTSTSRTLTIYYDGTTENTTADTSVTNHASFLNAPADIGLMMSASVATFRQG